MQNFLYKLRQFMYGRNGLDGFTVFLLILNIIIRSIGRFTIPWLFEIISIVIFVFAVYRIFSKNIYQRQKENRKFMNIFNSFVFWFKRNQTLAKERAIVKGTHKIYLCPKCKKKLKVPKGKGKIEIRCPCGNKFYKRT